ncbi:MAG: isopenicillin N synthase family oxygenase [Acidimicrobiaceae bacterium]|nr:isopenicillin N synthase family oxygenase [Acidimicrobiaceae bacterium]MCY4175451.1 isopenicillin N synthase family oxygenase [Acidimicrobiaceae bacterium]MCY4295258.1 isopenicillin N synthase family oxygenase [Acidimicrobiaceae bacterium]
MDILDVDLAAFEQGSRSRRDAVVDGVMRSLVTGFVYVAHDLGTGLIDEAYGALKAFFGLPQERKNSCIVEGAHGHTGYTPMMVETAAGSDVPDLKEMLNWGAPAPAGHPLRRRYPHRYGPPALPEADLPGVTELLLSFHERVLDVQRRVLRIIAAGLGAHEEFFDAMLAHGATLTRAIHYPPMRTAPGEGFVWAAEHGDINLITMLPRATAAGLQVRTDSGWVDAAPPEGSAIINTGMMLEHLSNGMIGAGIHRVVASEGQNGDRYSVVQFAHPTPWTILSPLPSCVTQENPLRFPSISSADALDKVIWEINLVEDGRRVEAV